MPAEDLKARTRRLFNEYNEGKAAAMVAVDDYYANDVVFHVATGEDIRSLKDYKQLMGGNYDAFPDARFTVDDIIVEGDKAAVRYTMTATHKGAYMGIPPTNKKVTIPLWGWARRNAAGKVVEQWVMFDTMSFMQQLGVVPTPGKGK